MECKTVCQLRFELWKAVLFLKTCLFTPTVASGAKCWWPFHLLKQDCGPVSTCLRRKQSCQCKCKQRNLYACRNKKQAIACVETSHYLLLYAEKQRKYQLEKFACRLARISVAMKVNSCIVVLP